MMSRSSLLPPGAAYRPLLLALVLLMTLASAAQVLPAPQRTDTPPPAEPARGLDHEYLISPDDVLDVYIVDVTEMSRAYRVSPNGTVTMPLLKEPLTAAGRTLAQFSDAITDALRTAQLVANPQVTVSVQQSRLHSVAITGAVKRPQIYSVFGRTTLLDVLSQAEGLAPEAGNLAIIRRGDIASRRLGIGPGLKAEEREAALTVTVDINRALETGDPAANVDVYPGDRITVPRAGIVYVVGAVNKPGGFMLKPGTQGMTVLQAIALAEDVKSTAVRQKALVIRADASAPDGRRQIPVNLKKVLAGKADDVSLQAEDILFVPDSMGKKAFRRGLEAALQASTGLIIYRR